MILLPALACLVTLELLPTVDLSVESTVSVPATWPVSVRSVEIPVLEPVELLLSVRSSTTMQCADVSKAMKEILLLAAEELQHVSTA